MANPPNRVALLNHDRSRVGNLYGEFIEEASKLITDALTHKLDDLSKLVPLYALISKLRLFAPPNVVALADEVMLRIFTLYAETDKSFHIPQTVEDWTGYGILRSSAKSGGKTYIGRPSQSNTADLFRRYPFHSLASACGTQLYRSASPSQ
jgi:hypothetical protein